MEGEGARAQARACTWCLHLGSTGPSSGVQIPNELDFVKFHVSPSHLHCAFVQ